MLVGAAIVVVSAIVLYLISVCSMKEKTFEEVMAEQKRLKELQVQPSKSKIEKERLKKRFRKGKGIKSDEPARQNASPKLEPETAPPVQENVVQYKEEPEIIEPVSQEKADSTKSKKSKKEKSSPKLNTRPQTQPDVVEEVTKTVVEQVAAPRVKDELELKQEREKILKKAEEMERERMPQAEKTKERKKKEIKKLEEIVLQEDILLQESSPVAMDPKKIKKNRGMEGGKF